MGKIKKFFGKKIFAVIGCLLLVVICAGCLWYATQSFAAPPTNNTYSAVFVGEYKTEEGLWQPIEEDTTILSEGTVTLKGQILKVDSDGTKQSIKQGEVVSFYLNHVCLTVKVDGYSQTFYCEIENHISFCGKTWVSYTYNGNGQDEMEITITNPHFFGNRSAVNEFLSNITLGDLSVVEEVLTPVGFIYRTIGIVIMAVALALFGVALVATILKISQSSILWALGGLALFVGILFTLDYYDIIFWSTSLIFNTFALQFCIMLTALFICVLATTCLTNTRKSVAIVLTCILGVVIALIAIICAVAFLPIYDTFIYWGLIQSTANLIFIILSLIEIFKASKARRLVLIACIASFIATIIDVAGLALGFFSYSICSKTVFILTFIISVFFAIRIIPQNHRAAINKKQLEHEVQQSHVSIMLSQIKPHFLYNSLTSIAELCEIDAKKAQAATIEFSEYLRGNMSAVNKKYPIPFATEYKHLQSYLTLEKIRFGDALHIVYDIKETAFELPALTVQPLVENAIKHGIRKAKKSGRVKIITRSDKKNYYVIIADDGVGFEVEKVYDDGKEHIGLQNVKSRLKSMCNGTLTIKSKIGAGTTVTVTIPREKK
ncbi:MAG: hypothetical protein E7370_04350 [Clostridiales bacterium]|nr:hypothetical protein [Clostridiales bacterium]